MNKLYRKHLLYLARFVTSFVSNRIGDIILRLKGTGLTAKAIVPVHQQNAQQGDTVLRTVQGRLFLSH